MKRSQVLLFVLIALLALVLTSCSGILGGGSTSGGWSGTAFDEGVVYTGTQDGRVVAVNSSSGDILWSYAITTTTAGGMSCSQGSAATILYTTPIVHGDLVYVGTYSGEVHALGVGSGEQVWVYPPKSGGYIGAVVGNPVIANGIIYTVSSDGKVYALNASNGKLKWATDSPLADKLWTSPAMQGDTLYVSTLDGHIYAVSLGSGELLEWSFAAEAGFASSPVIDGDTVYVGSFDRYLYAVKMGGNSSIWRFPPEEPADNWFWASPVIGGDTVYAACLDGRLYAIDSETGEELWEFDAGDPIVCSPMLIDDLLVVAAESGNVYVIDSETGNGERIENRENGDEPTIDDKVRAPFCAHDGLVYIRGDDNQLYIVDVEKRDPLTEEE